MISRAVFFLACLFVFTPMQARAVEVPDALKDVGIVEHLGSTVAIDQMQFKDETGKLVHLSDYFHKGHPVILNLTYFGCPNLCTYVLNGMVTALKQLDWKPGQQFEIVSVSFDPSESYELAAVKKRAYLNSYGVTGIENSWHFLTGTHDQIHLLTNAVGFNFKYVPEEKQFAHSAALFVLTPEGKISRYLYGIEFEPKDVKLALLEASNGKIGNVVDRILLFCYRYDAQTRKYSLYLMKLMQASGAGTVLVFGGYLAVFWRNERKGGLRFMILILSILFNSAFAGILPLAGTEIATEWDSLYNFLLVLSVIFFILVVGAMILFAVKYRYREGIKTKYITHHLMLELTWIAVPTILLLGIFAWGYSVYHDMRQAPSDAYEIHVIGKQWNWSFQYDDGRTTAGEVYAPINKPVKMILTAVDVLHGFFIPNFRIKQDAVPGMYTSVWFEAKVPGKHQIFCTEYCGTSHSGMLAKLVILDDKQWSDWQRGRKLGEIPDATENLAVNDSNGKADTVQYGNAAPERVTAGLTALSTSLAVHGKKVFERNQCTTCHSVDGSKAYKAGPSLKGLYNARVQLTDGEVIADDNYIRESIEKPQAKIVKGFGAGMPPYQGTMSETDMSALVAYIKSLK